LRCARDWLPDEAWPAMDEESLLADLEQWLLPAVSGMTRLEQLKRLDMSDILRQSLPWPLPRRLDEALPGHFTAPTGSRVRIRYQPGQAPAIPVRIQEMFGLGATRAWPMAGCPWWWSCSPGPAPLADHRGSRRLLGGIL
jgi:ATP-dependent helicase HrpB